MTFPTMDEMDGNATEDKSFSELKPRTKEDWRLVLNCMHLLRTASRWELRQLLSQHGNFIAAQRGLRQKESHHG